MVSNQSRQICSRRLRFALSTLLACWTSQVAAYVPDDPWAVTASGPTNGEGLPATLTWSVVPNNTSIPGGGSSNLVSYLDGIFSGNTALWMSLFQQSFNRWNDLGGITFVHEENDDGAQLQTFSGILGTRGDIRIAGVFDDGPGGTLAYANLPDIGDIVFDTGETTFFSESAGNYVQLRNTLMHEVGHTFGLFHVVSSTDDLLLEPSISTSIDGPQLDDIRGIQGLYGDALEKTNGGQGNQTFSLAHSLGTIPVGGSAAIGTDAAGPGQEVSATDTDFVSIANSSDTDFFSFSANAPSLLDVTLTPRGGVFSQAVEGGSQTVFDANARNNLSLAVLDSNGTTLLGFADNSAAGTIESLTDLSLDSPGQYFVRVQGANDNVQMFELQLSVSEAPTGLDGDYDDDDDVDGGDFFVWQRTFGFSGSGLADGNGDQIINGSDLQVWQENFGAIAPLGATVTVPEPHAGLVFCLGALALHAGTSRRLCPAQRQAR